MSTFTTKSELNSNLQAIQGRSNVKDFANGWDKFRAGFAGVDKFGHQTGWGKFVDFMFTMDPLILGSFGGIRENTKQDVLRRKGDDVSEAIEKSDYKQYVDMKAKGRGQAIGGGLEVAANVVAFAALAPASAAASAGTTAATAAAPVAQGVGAGAHAGTTISLGAGTSAFTSTGALASATATTATTATAIAAPVVSNTVTMASQTANTLVNGLIVAPTTGQLMNAGVNLGANAVGSGVSGFSTSNVPDVPIEQGFVSNGYDRSLDPRYAHEFAIDAELVGDVGTGGAKGSRATSVIGEMLGITDESGKITGKSVTTGSANMIGKIPTGTGKAANAVIGARNKMYETGDVVQSRFADKMGDNDEINGDFKWAQDIPFGIGHYFGGVQQAHTASQNMETELDRYRMTLDRSLNLSSNEYAG